MSSGASKLYSYILWTDTDESHSSFDQFKQAAKSAVVDVTELDKGIARYKCIGDSF